MNIEGKNNTPAVSLCATFLVEHWVLLPFIIGDRFMWRQDPRGAGTRSAVGG